jgi:hypothetical protein
MRKYLLLVALLATSNALAWSLDARPPTKPVCDRIDLAPAKSTVKPAVPAHEDTTATTDSTAVATLPIPTATSTPPRSGGAMGFSRGRNAPRWQSFLPGMFK